MANKKTDADAAFTDVSQQVEQAQEEAQHPAEFDEGGNAKPAETSGAVGELADEMARRASAGANGGGPWPEEVLRNNYIASNRRASPEEQYTSHEDQ